MLTIVTAVAKVDAELERRVSGKLVQEAVQGAVPKECS
jgi:hypothetical protein